MADLELMRQIMEQKEADIAAQSQPVLDDETRALAGEKRFTFDVINIPVDPLR